MADPEPGPPEPGTQSSGPPEPGTQAPGSPSAPSTAPLPSPSEIMKMRRAAQKNLEACQDKLYEATHDRDKIQLLEVMVTRQEKLRMVEHLAFESLLAQLVAYKSLVARLMAQTAKLKAQVKEARDALGGRQ